MRSEPGATAERTESGGLASPDSRDNCCAPGGESPWPDALRPSCALAPDVLAASAAAPVAAPLRKPRRSTFGSLSDGDLVIASPPFNSCPLLLLLFTALQLFFALLRAQFPGKAPGVSASGRSSQAYSSRAQSGSSTKSNCQR